MKYLVPLAFYCILGLQNTIAQEYYSDGSMKITAVSTAGKYGFEPTRKHAIKVGSIRNEKAFLATLAGPNGQKISYVRIGSCCAFKSKKAPMGVGLLDKWQITWEGQTVPLYIYLNAYEFKTPMCPVGLTIAAPNSQII